MLPHSQFASSALPLSSDWICSLSVSPRFLTISSSYSSWLALVALTVSHTGCLFFTHAIYLSSLLSPSLSLSLISLTLFLSLSPLHNIPPFSISHTSLPSPYMFLTSLQPLHSNTNTAILLTLSHYTFIPLFSSLPHTCTRTHISTNTHTHAHPRPSSSLCLFHTGSCLFADQKLFIVKEKLWKAASSFSHFMHNYRKFAASLMASLGCLPLAPLAGIGRPEWCVASKAVFDYRMNCYGYSK